METGLYQGAAERLHVVNCTHPKITVLDSDERTATGRDATPRGGRARDVHMPRRSIGSHS